MTLYKWSQTASADANADSTINWAEGQSPSSVNDSGRAMMAATAKYRDDIAGAIVTGGTPTAYTVSSYEVFDTLARLNGQMIAFTPHATNGATVTLNVDSLGAKPLRSAPGVELPAGTLIQGTPYIVVYNHASAAFYLHGFFGNPYNIPLGSGLPFFGPTAPNSFFVFPFGQAISRTAYSALFALFGTIYGAGDGSTTFNVPDLRGRVLAGKDDMGGGVSSPARLTAVHFGAVTGAVGTTLGAVGGSESHTLSTAQLASHTHSGTTGDDSPDHTHSYGLRGGNTVGGGGPFGPADTLSTAATSGASARHQHAFTTAASGSGNAHNNVQPTIICNYIIRVL